MKLTIPVFELVRLVGSTRVVMGFRDRLKVGEAGIPRGNRGRLWFDNQSHRHEVCGRHSGYPLQYAGKLARSAVEKRSAANVPLDCAVICDCFDRPPNSVSRHAIFRRKVAFSRKPTGPGPFPCGDAFAQRSFNVGGDDFGQGLPRSLNRL
jgi:hypothetical protein